VQYDSKTGEPIERKKFDPNTGEEIEQKFDPNTGKSIEKKIEGIKAKIVLVTGDIIQGKLINQDKEKIIVESEMVGTVTVERVNIKSISTGALVDRRLDTGTPPIDMDLMLTLSTVTVPTISDSTIIFSLSWLINFPWIISPVTKTIFAFIPSIFFSIDFPVFGSNFCSISSPVLGSNFFLSIGSPVFESYCTCPARQLKRKMNGTDFIITNIFCF
jgi:hypothetical protein